MYLRALNNGLLVLDPCRIFEIYTILDPDVEFFKLCKQSSRGGSPKYKHLPVEVAQNINNLPVEEAQNINIYKYKYLPIVMEPIEAQNDINLVN